jgi:hypothetical protein
MPTLKASLVLAALPRGHFTNRLRCVLGFGLRDSQTYLVGASSLAMESKEG